MSNFAIATLLAWGINGALAWWQRGFRIAVFISILGGVQALIAKSLVPQLGLPWPLAVVFQLGLFAPLLWRREPTLRPPWFHVIASKPAAWWFAGSFLAIPWAIASGLGAPLAWPWIPYVLALIGFRDVMGAGEEIVDIVLDEIEHGPAPKRVRSPRAARAGRPLKVVQITDPHLGAFMSAERLRKICERAVARDPDLILLTGDFLTVESNGDPESLAYALAPLAAMRGRTFACLGNHDHEAPDVVRFGLRSAGVHLLVDESVVVETEAGAVQIVGVDFVWRNRAEHLRRVCLEHPRIPDALRLVLMHDPGAFRHLPEGEGDLVLSGHTHGGQLGLLRLGLPYTILSALTSIPDHGLWARGKDRLYVHRGTGHYGFPLRLGVPAEYSMLQVHRA